MFPANGRALYEEHGYSPAIRSGDLLFVPGQVGSRSDGTPEPDFEAQVRRAYENLKATLEAGGCTFDDIVDVTVFPTVPHNHVAEDAAARAEMPSQAPLTNIAAHGVSWLAGFDFETTVTAPVPRG